MNYLEKKNFGIPAGILAAISVLLGYSLYTSSGLMWVILAFTAIVFLFDFDENVKNTLKQSLMLAFFGRLASFLFGILYSILSWFSGAEYAESEAAKTIYKLFAKVLDIAQDLVGFVFILLFASLLIAAIKGKAAKISFLSESVAAAEKETVVCPQCGELIDKKAVFCTKCGNKLK